MILLIVGGILFTIGKGLGAVGLILLIMGFIYLSKN